MRSFVVSLLVFGLIWTSALADGSDQGPTAIVLDSITPRSDSSADFFVLSKVNGDSVDNAETLTTQADRGRGFAMSPKSYDRRIPTAPVTVEISGYTHYAAPILALLHGSNSVSGTESFTPQPDHSYEVKGVMQDGDCAVWIEDTATATIVGQKFENKC